MRTSLKRKLPTIKKSINWVSLPLNNGKTKAPQLKQGYSSSETTLALLLWLLGLHLVSY